MKFCSTRGGVRGATFEEAISRGYAADGGLYVPEVLPSIGLGELERWRELDFAGLAEVILGLFLGDELGAAELKALVRECYAGFSHTDVVPVRRVAGLFVSELFHGPTFCFKDLGQQPLVRLLAHFAEVRGVRRSMLVSTTGDTGPAAMRAVSDVASPKLSIVVFFPEGQISHLQRKQMTTCSSDRAVVATFQGGGDDMDLPLKRMSADAAFATRHGLCGINSYNLGRPVAQLVHHFWTYFRVVDQLGLAVGAPVDVALPSGALGNLASGYMAKQMGLPVRRLIAGVNANDITHRTIARGEFHRSEQMEKTLSDAINIQVPYNMERILYYLTAEDVATVKPWMEEMDRSGRLTLPAPWLAKLQDTFVSRRVDDEAMCQELRRSFEEDGYLADPHTAVGLAAARGLPQEPAGDGAAVPLAVLATASPCKFEASITAAIGPERWGGYARGPDFPAAARAVLSERETPPRRLSGQGALAASQDVWEGAVRGLLDNGAWPEAPGRARL